MALSGAHFLSQHSNAITVSALAVKNQQHLLSLFSRAIVSLGQQVS